MNNIILIESDVIYFRHIPDEHYDFALNMGCLHMLVKKSRQVLHIQQVFKILKTGGKFW
ncbi:class I SAM-dependent methyltransferase [Bacteroidetes bacterium endosymbiont of Geopemphigus sp.]|uniref:class I SAM-dependent methyltransferase n=1 Tax=Bacteroidetes bacterium endosymbiont of Geopemphigus sp. TaxID=2047937 RepID=UPI0011AFA0F0|nr:class I SAM-dependent methyltransferase [Bacteroidetes bacterium endosymbiont of Geopemphigus sp.]